MVWLIKYGKDKEELNRANKIWKEILDEYEKKNKMRDYR